LINPATLALSNIIARPSTTRLNKKGDRGTPYLTQFNGYLLSFPSLFLDDEEAYGKEERSHATALERHAHEVL
jgi:hypothetical protein